MKPSLAPDAGSRWGTRWHGGGSLASEQSKEE